MSPEKRQIAGVPQTCRRQLCQGLFRSADLLFLKSIQKFS